MKAVKAGAAIAIGSLLTSVAVAQPVELTGAEMDRITAAGSNHSTTISSSVSVVRTSISTSTDGDVKTSGVVKTTISTSTDGDGLSSKMRILSISNGKVVETLIESSDGERR